MSRSIKAVIQQIFMGEIPKKGKRFTYADFSTGSSFMQIYYTDQQKADWLYKISEWCFVHHYTDNRQWSFFASEFC